MRLMYLQDGHNETLMRAGGSSEGRCGGGHGQEESVQCVEGEWSAASAAAAPHQKPDERLHRKRQRTRLAGEQGRERRGEERAEFRRERGVGLTTDIGEPCSCESKHSLTGRSF